MVFFFYGPDDFRIKEKVDSMAAGYKAKHKSGINFRRFDFSRDGRVEELKIFLESCSMFREKKMAVIENIFEAEEEAQEALADYLKKGDLFSTEEKFLAVSQSIEPVRDKKKKEKYSFKNKISEKLFEFLTSDDSHSEELDFLSGIKLENWIKKKVQNGNGKIEPLAVRKLVEFTGSDLWRMENEIQKLVAYKAGEIITFQDIDSLVQSKIETDIFKTIDALAVRNKLMAFRHLHRHLSQGESEIYLLNMLVYQFRNLLLVKSEAEQGASLPILSKKIKLHPFVLRKSFEQSKNFSLSALKNIYERLMEADQAIKSGKIEPKVALDILVAEITG